MLRHIKRHILIFNSSQIDANSALAAIRDLNGVSIDGGKPIKVSD